MKLTTYTIRTDIPSPLKIIIAADLHSRPYQNSLEMIESVRPDLILSPGDMVENAAVYSVQEGFNRTGFDFMKRAAKIVPFFYSLGNHERGMSEENLAALQNAGITLLDNCFVTLRNGVHLGGLTSGFVNAVRGTAEYKPMEPDFDFLEKFTSLSGFKILLCHHPEYYPKYLRDMPVELIVSGHAHGGQWKFFGRSVYAPCQGLFPKYASGVFDNRLCISCGMANTVIFPRFFNPRELVLLALEPFASGPEET